MNSVWYRVLFFVSVFIIFILTTQIKFAASQNCQPTEFQCPSTNMCLSREVCDGYADCPGGEDEEQNCETCTEFQIKCESDGKCIPSYLKCNWAVDCEDGSDEFNCPTPPPMEI